MWLFDLNISIMLLSAVSSLECWTTSVQGIHSLHGILPIYRRTITWERLNLYHPYHIHMRVHSCPARKKEAITIEE